MRIADIVGMIAINEVKIKGKCDLAKILSGVKCRFRRTAMRL